MNKKWLLFILLMASGLIWLLIAQHVKETSPLTEVNHVTSIDAKQPAHNSIIKPETLSDGLKEASSKTDDIRLKQHVLNDIETRLYSDDAYVELASLDWLIGLCHEDLVGERLFFGYGTYYQPQQKLATEVSEKCQSLRDKYPTLMAHKDSQYMLSLFKPSSPLGKLIQRLKDPHLTSQERHELSDLILINAIKEGNSGLMMQTAYTHLFAANTDFPIKTLLKTQDQAYASQVSGIAIMLLSCQYQAGHNCESTSFYMIISCSQNPLACGHNYPAWYQQITLPGMQKDVQKLMGFYQQFSQ